MLTFVVDLILDRLQGPAITEIASPHLRRGLYLIAGPVPVSSCPSPFRDLSSWNWVGMDGECGGNMGSDWVSRGQQRVQSGSLLTPFECFSHDQVFGLPFTEFRTQWPFKNTT